MVSAAVLLLIAALHDIAFRTIPDSVPAGLLIAGIVLRALLGGMAAGLALSLAVFALAVLCWRRGWMGGGDVKLLAATVLVVPPPGVGPFLLLTVQAGGVLGLLYLLLSRTVRLPTPGRRGAGSRNIVLRVARAERWRICRGAPLPYGFAIAVGGITLLLK